MLILSQLHLLIQNNLNKNSSRVFVEFGKLILKFIEKCEGPRTHKTILKKKKVVRIILPNSKTDLKLQ